MLLFFEFYWLGCVGFLIGLMLSPNFSFDRFSFFDALRACPSVTLKHLAGNCLSGKADGSYPASSLATVINGGTIQR